MRRKLPLKIQSSSPVSLVRESWQGLITPSLAQQLEQIGGQSCVAAFVVRSLRLSAAAFVFPPRGTVLRQRVCLELLSSGAMMCTQDMISFPYFGV